MGNIPFLTAEWRKLLMVNYVVDPKTLEPFLPKHTEIDFYNGKCYVSLIGFMFLNTKVLGLKIPFHVNFEEVNLRFYVRHYSNGEWRRGVVFIKEIVPRQAIVLIANGLYGEHYEALKMKHEWIKSDDKLTVNYSWLTKGIWQSMQATTTDIPKEIAVNSEVEFITEHYWGYTKLSESKTSEYGVEHPRWSVYDTLEYNINVDFEAVYGARFKLLNDLQPISVFLAEGSEIRVLGGNKF
jgi:uncharacterized protein